MLVARGLLEEARDRDTVKGNGTKRKTGGLKRRRSRWTERGGIEGLGGGSGRQ